MAALNISMIAAILLAVSAGQGPDQTLIIDAWNAYALAKKAPGR